MCSSNLDLLSQVDPSSQEGCVDDWDEEGAIAGPDAVVVWVASWVQV